MSATPESHEFVCDSCQRVCDLDIQCPDCLTCTNKSCCQGHEENAPAATVGVVPDVEEDDEDCDDEDCDDEDDDDFDDDLDDFDDDDDLDDDE